MLRLFRILAACSLGWTALPADGVEFTIDRSVLREIKSDERVLAYVIGPAYYVLDSKGNNILSSFPQKPAYLSEHFKTTIFFFLARKDAEQYRLGYEAQLKDQGTVKQTALSTILAQQHRTVGMPIEENPRTPDFILFQTFPPTPIMVEFLVSKDAKTFYSVHAGQKKYYVPAFFFHADAVKFQAQVNSQPAGQFDRISLDFGTFLRKFMRPQAGKDVPMVLFGEDAERLMREFEKAYAGTP